jgi:deoxyribonuclease V
VTHKKEKFTVPHISHPWEVSPQEALALQKQLARQVIREAILGPVATVAGVDASYRDGLARAAVVTLSYPDLEVVEYATATRPVEFSYVPGLLTFREGPAVLDALDKLTSTPDLLIFDGQGMAHPRRLGVASHIGLLVDIPSIGCAKRRLCGQCETPGPERGDYTLLTDKGETIGAVVRTRARVKPVFVSIGHRVDLPTSINYVLRCCRGYRLPETTRWAHQVAGGEVPPVRLQDKLKLS